MTKLNKNKKLDEKILELEQELRTTKYNKRTQGTTGLLKTKIARLKEAKRVRSSKGSKSTGYNVKKTDEVQARLLHLKSSEKSKDLNSDGIIYEVNQK